MKEKLQSDVIAIIKTSDETYSASKCIPLAPNAVRVEQGEYAVVSTNRHISAVGTHNVNQCVVLYVRNESAKLHGLAHVDGHTEIISLKNFFDECGDMRALSGIQIFGGGGSISSLDDPKRTVEKIQKFLV